LAGSATFGHVAPADPSVRARSFGSIAEDYDRYRPGPPAEAIDWLLPEPCTTALDVGAGTGALTRELVGRVPTVVAVEPDPRMRDVLGRLAGADALGAVAEALPLVDGCADAVLVSSAWHWMDPARSTEEFGRVLRPGGVLGLLWNGPDRRQPWVAELFERGRRPDRDTGPPRRAGEEWAELFSATFHPVERRVVTWSRPFRPDDLVGMAGTYSSVITLPDDERARVLADVARFVAEHPNAARGGGIDLPMACRCVRLVRR